MNVKKMTLKELEELRGSAPQQPKQMTERELEAYRAAAPVAAPVETKVSLGVVPQQEEKASPNVAKTRTVSLADMRGDSFYVPGHGRVSSTELLDMHRAGEVDFDDKVLNLFTSEDYLKGAKDRAKQAQKDRAALGQGIVVADGKAEAFKGTKDDYRGLQDFYGKETDRATDREAYARKLKYDKERSDIMRKYEKPYGNIDIYNRQRLDWTDEALKKYGAEIKSWGKSPENLKGDFSTVLGGSAEYDGTEVAFSPMLQTKDGAVLLSVSDVDAYINKIIERAGKDRSKENILKLDAQGLNIGGRHIKGLIADVGGTSAHTATAMHETSAADYAPPKRPKTEGERIAKYLTDPEWRLQTGYQGAPEALTALDYATDIQRRVMLNLANRGDYDSLAEYAKATEFDRYGRMKEKSRELLDKAPVVRAALPLITDTYAAPVAFAEGVKQAITGDGDPANLEKGAMGLLRLGQYAQEKTLEDKNWAVKGAGNLGYGLASWGLALSMGGAALPVMAAGSAGTLTTKTLEKGVEPKTAVAYGAAIGGLTYMLRKYGVKKFFGDFTGGAERVMGFEKVSQLLVHRMAEQTGVGFASGAGETIARNLADTMMLTDKSDYKTLVRKYKDEGLTQNASEAKAFMELFAKQPAMAGLQRAAISAIAAGIGHRQNLKNIGKQLREQSKELAENYNKQIDAEEAKQVIKAAEYIKRGEKYNVPKYERLDDHVLSRNLIRMALRLGDVADKDYDAFNLATKLRADTATDYQLGKLYVAIQGNVMNEYLRYAEAQATGKPYEPIGIPKAEPAAEPTAKPPEVAVVKPTAPITSEADELLSTAPAVRYAPPDSRGAALEDTLINRGVSDTERKNIIGMLGNIEKSFEASGKKIDSVINIVNNLDTAVSSELKDTFGGMDVSNKGATYRVTLDLITDPDKPITDSFITAYARLWIDMWRKSNSMSYVNVLNHWEKNGLDTSAKNMAEQMKAILYKEIIGDKIDAKVAEDKLFGRNAGNFKDFLGRVVDTVSTVRNKLWGKVGEDFQEQAKAFASGDWSGVLAEEKPKEKPKPVIEEAPETKAVISGADDIVPKRDMVKTTGKTNVAYTNNNEPVEFTYAIVSADDLITSNDIYGEVNPAYPQELQPRDRTRATSRVQIGKMAGNIMPERLGENPSVSDGAPIIGADGVVESGNGRVLALLTMYGAGKGQHYIDFLKNNAEKFGIDAGSLPAKPVLVRERTTPVDRAEFVKQANESQLASMSATETAKADAERMDDDILSMLNPNDDGEINRMENKAFISAFVNKVVPENERGTAVTEDGFLSQQGKARVIAAIFYKAYNDESLAMRLSESLEDDMKNVTKTLTNIAPKVASIKNGISRGVNFDLDFSQDIVESVKLLSEVRSAGNDIEQYVEQVVFGEKASPLVMALASIFEQKRRSVPQTTEFFNVLFEQVESLGNPEQVGMFKADKITKEGALKNAIRIYNSWQTDDRRRIVGVPWSDAGGDRLDKSDTGVSESVAGAQERIGGFLPREAEQIELGDIPEDVAAKEPKPTESGERIIYIGTGQPASRQAHDVLSRIEAGGDTSVDELYSIPEEAAARKRVGTLAPTVSDNSEERRAIRRDVLEQLTLLGSYSGVDNSGKAVYNGIVKKSRRVDVVIGLPAAGKSSVLADPLSQEHGSRIIDSDMAKELLPEYDNGYGAGRVHEESSLIRDELLAAAVEKGENIVLPVVGGNLQKLTKTIERFKSNGYSAYLHLNELPINKAAGRAVRRFLETGRYVDPGLVFQVGNKPTENYKKIRGIGGLLDGYSHYSNDVQYGQEPILIESGQSGQSTLPDAEQLRGDGVERRVVSSGEAAQRKTESKRAVGVIPTALPFAKAEPKEPVKAPAKKDEKPVAKQEKPNVGSTDDIKFSLENPQEDNAEIKKLMAELAALEKYDIFKISLDERFEKRKEISRVKRKIYRLQNPRTAEQKALSAAKNKAKKEMDRAYFSALERGDLEEATKLVEDYAKSRGYVASADYKGAHSAPTNDGFCVPIYELDRIYPEDIYSDKARLFYGDGVPYDGKALYALQSVRGEPDKKITIYRALPASVKEGTIRNGDWVTVTREYAELHGKDNLDEPYKIIWKRVPAKHVYTNADSIHEMGYDNGQKMVYANTLNNAKLLDTIVKDGSGAIIPLSKRFDKRRFEAFFSTERSTDNDLLLHGDARREDGASAGGQRKGLDGGTGETREAGETGRGDEAARRVYAENAKANGQVEERTVAGAKLNLIDESAHNDDMKSIAAANKARGIVVTRFFVGPGLSPDGTKIRGMIVNGKEVYVRYDGEKSPQQISLHEIAHKEYRTAKMRKVENYIRNSLSVAEKHKIIYELYKSYLNLYDGNEEKVFEEFICDVLSGLNEYSTDFEPIVTEFWEDVPEIYTPAEYAELMDAGGSEADNIGFVEGVSPIPQGFTSAGTSLNQDIRFSVEEISPERIKEIKEQFDRDRAGIIKPSMRELFGEYAKEAAHFVGRVFPDLPERGERGTFFAEFRKSMIQWRGLSSTAAFKAMENLNKMTEGLSKEEYRTFSELVYFLDLQEEAKLQEARGYDEILLPNEITPDEVNAIVEILRKESTGKVNNALKTRKDIWDKAKRDYIDVNAAIGFNTAEKFGRENYYHHQVIEHMSGGGRGGPGDRIKVGRGWLKERKGSTLATNTDFLAVEYQTLMQMQYDTYIATALYNIKEQYDIKPQLEKEAFKLNKETLERMIADEASKNSKDGFPVFIKQGNKLVPDSDIYRRQQWFNQRIMLGFSKLFELAKEDGLDDINGVYKDAVKALKEGRLDEPTIYSYLADIAALDDFPETAQIAARTVLKYTAQKKAFIKETLGKAYQTWETLIKDGYSIFQPRRGNYFYTKEVVAEDAFGRAIQEVVENMLQGEGVEMDAKTKEIFEEYRESIRLIGAAFEQWVIPNEIITTLEKVGNPAPVSNGLKVFRHIMNIWKAWVTTGNPKGTFRFGLRNFFGDLDAAVGGKPGVIKYSMRATKEIRAAMRHKKYSKEYWEWVERGGFGSMLRVNTVDKELMEELFGHLLEKADGNILKAPVDMLINTFKGYDNVVDSAHNFREAILRYAAYLYFKNAIEKDGMVKDYVASNRSIVDGLKSVEDKAYQLSKDLLGAYDEVSAMGQVLRRYWAPFWSFTETNHKRYFRMFENALRSGTSIPEKALNLIIKAIMVNWMALMIAAWNRLVQKDNDDKLPADVRARPHITLGRIGDNIYAFTRLGSFTELLEWYGLDDYKWTKDDFIEPVNQAFSMLTPFIKTPFELASGVSLYPDVRKPRQIRDKMDYIFHSLGVANEFRAITGRPSKPFVENIDSALLYKYDYKESAYYEVLDRKRAFQKQDDISVVNLSKKSLALKYMKNAVRYGDRRAALKYLDKYFEEGGTGRGVVQSFKTMNPMYGFTSKETFEKGEAFVKSLTPNEKSKLKIAMRYYERELMLPDDIVSALGKKDITDAEAKTILRRYVMRKTK